MGIRGGRGEGERRNVTIHNLGTNMSHELLLRGKDSWVEEVKFFARLLWLVVILKQLQHCSYIIIIRWRRVAWHCCRLRSLLHDKSIFYSWLDFRLPHSHSSTTTPGRSAVIRIHELNLNSLHWLQGVLVTKYWYDIRTTGDNMSALVEWSDHCLLGDQEEWNSNPLIVTLIHGSTLFAPLCEERRLELQQLLP